MAHRRQGRRRGLALVELMVATAIMAVAVLGFISAIREVLNSTATAHRRTEEALLRTGLMDRLSVTRRSAIDLASGAGWIVEACYDVDANQVASNATLAAGFACPATAIYVRHLSVTAVPDAAGADQRIWSVALYVDRTDHACTPATRHTSLACVAADLYLTD